MRGSLGDAAPGGPPARPAPRFDLRAELGQLAGEPHPFAFWQRLEQLPDRFAREQQSAARPTPESRPSTGGLPSLSGDLGGSGLSGSLDAEHRSGFSGGLSGSLIPPQAENAARVENPPPPEVAVPVPDSSTAAEQASGARSLRGDLPPAPAMRDGVFGAPSARPEPQPTPRQEVPAPPAPQAPEPPRPPMPEASQPQAPVAPPPSGPVPQPPGAPDSAPNRHAAPEPPRRPEPPRAPVQQPAPAPQPPQAGPPPVPPPPQGPPPGPPRQAGPPAPPPQPGPTPQVQRPPEPAEPPKPAPKTPSVRVPKPVERVDGGFGPVGSSGALGVGTGKSGHGRLAFSVEDFKEERSERDDLSVGSGYKPGETGSGAVPQFLIEADELFDDDEDGARLVAPPVLGESPSSFRDF